MPVLSVALPSLRSLVLSLALAAAQEPPAQVTPPATSQEAIDQGLLRMLPQGEVRGIDLETCLRLAFANNLGLKALAMGVEITDTAIEESLGAFDPTYYTMAEGSHRTAFQGFGFTLGANRLLESATDLFTIGTGVRGASPSGLQYDVGLSFDHNFNTFDSIDFQTGQLSVRRSEYVTNQVGLSLTQPLLRGFGSTVNKGPLYEARNSSRLARLELEQQMLDLGFRVVQAFWDYRFAIEAAKTAEETLGVARELLDINEKKWKAGVFTEVDVLRASDEVQRRQANLIEARSIVGNNQDTLRRLIFALEGEAEWKLNYFPRKAAELPVPPVMDWDAVVRETLERRPDLAAKRIGLENLDIEIALAENARLPGLNLLAAYGYSSQGSNFGNSLDFLEDREFPSYSAGLSLEVPIGNRTAAARLQRSRIQRLQAEVELHDLEAGVVEEVRRALRTVESSREKITAATESRGLAEKLYRKERKRLEAGEGTSFLVREAQRDLFVARNNELRALLDHEIALAELSRARGTLLENYGIALPQPRDEQGSIFY
ncbi:MAG: TolC family protein [Planctomycetota bacterium]